MMPSLPNLSVIGPNFTLNNEARALQSTSTRRVLVTPIPAGQGVCTQGQPAFHQASTHHIYKVLLKTVCRGTKQDPKTFTLRISEVEVCSSDRLKHAIKSQLQDDIGEKDFDVGVYHGNNIVSIRSKEDVMDVWKDIKDGVKVILWCDGLRAHKGKRNKTPLTDDDDSDGERAQTGPKYKKKKLKKTEEREDKVHDRIKQLKEKHGNSFSPMQLRIWSEMIVGEVHSSLDEPPNTSMFIRAGNTATTKKKDHCGTAHALTEVATAIASALSPAPPSCGRGSSPAKLIEGRSKCYKQLSELKNLNLNGILSNEEYRTEKEAIMAILNTLKASQ